MAHEAFNNNDIIPLVLESWCITDGAGHIVLEDSLLRLR